MAPNASPEKAPLSPKPSGPERVVQPAPVKIEGLAQFLEAVNSLEVGKVGETMTEDTSARDAGGGGGGFAAAAAARGMSARDFAIANLPTPHNMQRQLEQHIREEVKKLRKQAHHVAKVHGPGAAYHLNKLYARIRQLNNLLGVIFDAGMEVLKRFFIRVFIDRQPIL